MNHPRITKREWGLIKGALRRAFSRSELRNQVLDASIVPHLDPSRPKVKTWCRCASCHKLEAKSYMVVDHIDPVVPLHTNFADMSLEDAVARLWCAPTNLQVLCEPCHALKTKAEAKARKLAKKQKSKKRRQ